MRGNFQILSLVIVFINTASAMAQPEPSTPPGFPLALSSSAAQVQKNASALVFKNFDLPLTIGEMSALQAKKLDEDFLRKLGYTSTPVIVEAPTPKVSLSQRRAASEAVAMAKPRDVISTVSIYGSAGKLSADIAFNGAIFSVKNGTNLPAGYFVQSINTRTVEIISLNKKKDDVQHVHPVAVGETIELIR